MATRFTLGRNERLKSRKQIELLFTEGQRFVVAPFRVFYLFQQEDESATKGRLQMGVGASTRYFKRAVDRNRIKRLVRESWRLQKNELGEKLQEHNKQLNVFLVYTGKDLPAYKDAVDKIKLVLEKLLDKTI